MSRSTRPSPCPSPEREYRAGDLFTTRRRKRPDTALVGSMAPPPDHDWLARTYHELKHDLLTVAVHLTGERSAGEDVVHDVFVAFVRRGPDPTRLASVDDARRYLVASCVHRARDLERRRAAQLDDGSKLAR